MLTRKEDRRTAKINRWLSKREKNPVAEKAIDSLVGDMRVIF